MRILVTGADGQIGWELARQFASPHVVIASTRASIDLASPASIRGGVRDAKPDVIINAAAHTAVDRAESEPAAARAINADAVGFIGEEAKRLGAVVIHFSTDYVYDGTKRTPYVPDDAPNPQSVYGATKLAGEKLLLESGAAAVILRTCWVYGTRGRNFVLAILRAAEKNPSLRIVNDQIGCPTWCRMAARVAARIAEGAVTGEPGRRHFGGLEGVYHVAGGGSTTWYDLARLVFELTPARPTPQITPITTAEYGAPARRPAYSVLDCSATQRAFGVRMDDWRESLRQALAERADVPASG